MIFLILLSFTFKFNNMHTVYSSVNLLNNNKTNMNTNLPLCFCKIESKCVLIKIIKNNRNLIVENITNFNYHILFLTDNVVRVI